MLSVGPPLSSIFGELLILVKHCSPSVDIARLGSSTAHGSTPWLLLERKQNQLHHDGGSHAFSRELCAGYWAMQFCPCRCMLKPIAPNEDVIVFLVSLERLSASINYPVSQHSVYRTRNSPIRNETIPLTVVSEKAS